MKMMIEAVRKITANEKKTRKESTTRLESLLYDRRAMQIIAM